MTSSLNTYMHMYDGKEAVSFGCNNSLAKWWIIFCRFYAELAKCMMHRLLAIYSSSSEVIGLIFNFLSQGDDNSKTFLQQVSNHRCHDYFVVPISMYWYTGVAGLVPVSIEPHFPIADVIGLWCPFEADVSVFYCYMFPVFNTQVSIQTNFPIKSKI